jgi:hypothetical protein
VGGSGIVTISEEASAVIYGPGGNGGKLGIIAFNVGAEVGAEVGAGVEWRRGGRVCRVRLTLRTRAAAVMTTTPSVVKNTIKGRKILMMNQFNSLFC